MKNIVKYLKNSEDIQIISQRKEKLVICFSVDDNFESIVSYVKELEKSGFQLSLMNSTISQTYELKKMERH